LQHRLLISMTKRRMSSLQSAPQSFKVHGNNVPLRPFGHLDGLRGVPSREKSPKLTRKEPKLLLRVCSLQLTPWSSMVDRLNLQGMGYGKR
jgi:hypothetical protein